MRFISSSNTSSMRSVSLMIDKLLTQLPPGMLWDETPAVWLTAAQMPARDSGRHGTGDAGNFFIYDLDTIAEFLRHLLDNMYVQFGDQLLRQVIGTPMRTSLLANFCLPMYELAFLENLANLATNTMNPQAKQTQAKQILSSFLMTGRYIDDLLSINNPYLKFLLYINQTLFYHDLHGIYPDTLLLKCAHSGTEVPFMDISIRPSGHGSCLTTELHDKRRHEPLLPSSLLNTTHVLKHTRDSQIQYHN